MREKGEILPFYQWNRPRTWHLLVDMDLEAAEAIFRSRFHRCIGWCWEIRRWVCLCVWEQEFSYEQGSSSPVKGSSQWSSNSLLSIGSEGLSLPKQFSPSSHMGKSRSPRAIFHLPSLKNDVLLWAREAGGVMLTVSKLESIRVCALLSSYYQFHFPSKAYFIIF